MQKSFKIIFYTLLGLFCCGVIYLTTVMYLSPRQDAKERGFIPCTKQLVVQIHDCDTGSIGCPFMLLMKDMGCNIGVVYAGAADWIAGKQPTPWANYLFEPEAYKDETYPDEPPLNAEDVVPNLQQQSQFIEQKLQKLEAAKHRQLNIEASELLQDPELQVISESVQKNIENTEEALPGDISDETNIKIAPEKTGNTAKITAPNEPNVLHIIKKQTDETLQKGNSKDEK